MIAIFYLVLQILKLYSYVVIANVVISWLVAFNVLNTQNRFVYSILEVTYRLTNPALNKIRSFLPNLGSIDISPVILLLLIWFIEMCMKLVHCANDFLGEHMILIDGKKIAAELREELRQEVVELKAKHNKIPGLTVILIGEMAPSQIYVRMKEKAANEVGLKSEVIRYPEAVEEKTVLDKIEELNKDESISGILVQLPLPKHIDKQKVIETILPGKDVDGFHPMNVGNLSSGYESSVPCTPLGCYLMIKKIEPNLSGKKAVMIGRSNLNGKPMAQLLLKENCTVTITHSKTKDLKAECLEADIIVAAVGIPELVKADWVKKDAIVIDVGINKTENGIVGDVAFEEVSKVARALTPVPGGVGPMTIACLLKNTIECFKRSQK